MTPLDLCEPVFQYVCMLNRIGRAHGGDAMEYGALRGVIKPLLGDLQTQAERDPVLRSQMQKLELPLEFFVDSMIAESSLGCAAEWNKNRLAYERGELAGDEKFFDLLEETLADSTPQATERLAVFYVCLGLGFTGWYSGQPEYLRRKMADISQRIKGTLAEDKVARICPEAYQSLDTRNLIEAPGVKLAAILIALACFCLVAAVVNFYLFRTASLGLSESLSEILRHDLFHP